MPHIKPMKMLLNKMFKIIESCLYSIKVAGYKHAFVEKPINF